MEDYLEGPLQFSIDPEVTQEKNRFLRKDTEVAEIELAQKCFWLGTKAGKAMPCKDLQLVTTWDTTPFGRSYRAR